MTAKAGSGHPTSCLSAADLIAAIFFYGMQFNPNDFDNPDNDRFILSKGHAAPLLYAIWQELGLLTEEQLYAYRQFDSPLEGHPTRRFNYAEAATGSLGMGLSLGAGIALSAQMQKRDFYAYVLLGDSELAEGSIWEAAELSSYYKLHNLIAVVDCNRLGQTGETMHDYHLERIAAKFESFGWHAITINNGHDMIEIMGALDKARKEKHPTVIVAKTIKGYGIAEVENKNGYHGKPFAQQDMDNILKELDARFAREAADGFDFEWKPRIPQKTKAYIEPCSGIYLGTPTYQQGSMIATRKVYGQALAAAGKQCKQIISLDAEVKNSTYAQLFEDAFSDRFIQCFIAEQNMVSMAVGLQSRGYIPFVSTFSAFFSRAYDQLRMAAIGTCPLRCCGSHAGVSIGQDGPSQMGLEDIALMSSLPGSVVLYPADAVSTYRLVEQMAAYNQGISYLRTTRPDTPVIYDNNAKFYIGGCNVVRSTDHDKACIIAAGITLFQALKAADQLEVEGIAVSVIDLYSIKPLDQKTILATARASGNRIITVEDHYLQGGIGQQVCYALRNENIKITSLAVTEMPRSGKPEELMAWAGIDAAAIVRAVKKL